MKLPRLQTLAERVVWARKRKDWTQDDLATACGSTRDQIVKVELGKTRRPRNMQDLAKALDVPPAWLAFGDERIDDLSKEAIEIALGWQTLPAEVQEAVARLIRAAKHE